MHTNAVLNRLSERGERLTIQRRLVIEALCSGGGHLSIPELRAFIEANHRGHDLPDPTIYRILQWLKDLQLVSQTDMGSSGIVYELVDDPPHHHLICLNCGAIIDVDDGLFTPLRERLETEHRFLARIEHMAIYGLCRDCTETAK